ncbi:MAG: secondary thiamine-phosphate synthase enzyme YjbQ [Blastocatellia bacterium]
MALKCAPDRETGPSKVFHRRIRLTTSERLQFIDLTERIIELVKESGIQHGLVNVQTRHTTTAIIVNEHEPLLLEDMKKALDRIAPPDQYYQHNDFSIRTVNLEEEENGNGHSHCQALFLPTAEQLNLTSGRLELGKWQRIFLLELDCARERSVSVMIFGC